MMAYLRAIGAVILPNIGGMINGIYYANQISRPGEKTWYDDLKKAPWNPPNWLFGPAWTILYSSMGFASYLVYEDCGGFTKKALVPLTLYAVQLILNWAWMPIFFGMRKYKLAFIDNTALTATVIATTISFFKVNKTAGAMLVPYIAWLCYAGSLNYYVWQNNPSFQEHRNDDMYK